MPIAKRKWTIVFCVTQPIVVAIVVVILGFLWLERSSSNELLDKLALAKPGVNLPEISDRLGPQMRECTSVAELLTWGSMQDEAFCREKKLYWFHATSPPCRAIEVYTDANDVIVYATWRQL